LQNILFSERKEKLDRVDKVLLVLPILPFADLVSTLFSLRLGGVEIGILARPVLENYGSLGLVWLSASASIAFFVLMVAVIRIKGMFVNKGWNFTWTRYVLAVPVYWFFMLEGLYVSTVVMNFLVPIAPLVTETIILRALPVIAYFTCATALTMSAIRQLPPYRK